MQAAPFNLREQAYERIREMVLSGELAPGSRASTLELARQLNISRTPIREAIYRLVQQGLMREAPGYGAFVQMPDRQELVELYGMREVLEGYAAAEAARHIQPHELAQLDGLCQEWRGMIEQIRLTPAKRLERKMNDRWVSLDERFHEVLLRAARNRLLARIIADCRLMSRTLDLRRFDSTAFVTLSGAARTYRQHLTLVKALRRHDPAAAEHWMSQQMRTGREQHLAYFDRTARRRSAEKTGTRFVSATAGAIRRTKTNRVPVSRTIRRAPGEKRS